MHQVHILDVNYMYINTVSWKKAVKLMLREGRVEVLATSDIEIRDGFRLPLVLRLLKYVRRLYGAKVPWSRDNLLVRDRFTCQYCGERKPARDLSVDHVVPECKGGKTTFENCVTACKPCNQRKGGRTPREAGMFPRRMPTAPTIMEFFRLKLEAIGGKQVLEDLGLL